MSRRDEIIELASDLIRFESTAARPDQCAAALDYVQRYLDTIPGLFCHRSESEGKPAIVATLHDTRTPALLLNGHIDVVPGHPDQFTPSLHDNRLVGRAALDMKGSVAVLLCLLKELADHDPRPDVGVQIVSDEEIGGDQGTGRLLAEGWRCGLFLAAEPTDLRICYEQKGILWMQVRLWGVSAHASRPWHGKNPMFPLAAGLQQLAQRFPLHDSGDSDDSGDNWYTTVTPTLVQTSNTTTNSISEEVRLTLDVRHVPQDSPDQIIAAVQACFPDAEVVCMRAAPLMTDPDTPAVQQLAAVATQVMGQSAQLYREHYGSDARFYSQAGIPAVCFGPTGAGMHAAGEWVDCDSLDVFYRILKAYAMLGEFDHEIT